MGGIFMLASIFIIGAFFIYGYLARLVRNVIAGDAHPLPEWDDLGEYFSEGLRMFGVALVYMLPFIFLMFIFIVPSIVAEAADSDAMRNIGGGMAACVWCILFPLGLAMALWLPGALLFTAVERRFGAGFEFAQIAAFIKANIGNYLLAFVVWLVVRMVVPFGFILLCVGVFFTSFWSLVVAAYSFGQVWRLAPSRK
ncbi:MAG TPA: DUF4013 domain-containing protein [Thermoanaerobaculia bacterium]|jgi:hypothetical protein|nr:DUF4013 domain-containing protein [Thermoanaerobaculia bacterium]